MSANQHLSINQVRAHLIATFPPHPTDSTIDELQERILVRIDQSDSEQINGVILDVEAVETVDSFLARTIIETTEMIELMGASSILVGISPAIAITATELGYTLGDMKTALDTDTALDILDEET